MTRHYIGLPGFLQRLPLLAPEGADSDEYAGRLRSDLRDGQRTTVRVMLSGRQVDLQLNPAVLMWWYVSDEGERRPDDMEGEWLPSSE